jgi:HEAT repeat protein
MGIDESSEHTSGEFNLTTYIQSLQFKLRCYEGSGEDFQRLFEDIMERARPGFIRVRPYGNIGDRKCDGFLPADGTIFQVYSPDELKQAEVQKKIDEDLEGAVKHWGDTLKTWVFVYNARRGLAPDIVRETLQEKQKQYPNITLEPLSNHALWEISCELSVQQRAEILGLPVFDQLAPLGFKPDKNAVCQFLEDIENDERFKYIGFFHTPQEVVLKEQYISIEVTLEAKRKDVESFWGYVESETELQRAYALKGMGEEFQRSQVAWKEARKQYQRLMVLADPGMGKSTLLKMEAGTTAQREKQKLLDNEITVDEAVFPLFLRLSDLIDEKIEEIFKAEIIDIIPVLIQRDYPKTAATIPLLLNEKLEKGKCVLLLDALDEVPREHRNCLKDKLNRFAGNYPCPIICTSRIVGYGGALVKGAKEVEIVPFSHRQTEEYIEIWFKYAAGYIDNSISAKGLIQELRNKPQIGGLAQNPLLLSLLCSLYQEKGLTLPARRTQVYEKAVDCMLQKWSQNRKPQSEGKIRAKVRLLEELAYHFSCEGKEIFSSDELYDWIEEYLQGEKVPTVFRKTDTGELISELSEEDGILQKLAREGDRYLFLHRTFQEYLTACYLNRARDSIALAREHFWEYDWHETLNLLAGLMENPVPLLEAITAEKDDIFLTLLLLAGRCVTECEENSHPLIAEIIDKIYELWCCHQYFGFIKLVVVVLGQTHSQMFEKLQKDFSEDKSYVRESTVEALGRIGNPQAVDALITVLKQGGEYIRAIAAVALGKIGSSEAVSALIQTLSEELGCVGRSAASALAEIGNPQAVNALITALSHEKGDIRASAASALGRINNSQAVEALIIALNEEDSFVRSSATSALGEIGSPEAVQALIIALSDEDRFVRKRVAKALSKIGSPHAVSALITALSDEDWEVRVSAAEALSKSNTPEAVVTLTSALTHEDRTVRLKAVAALSKIDSSEALEALIAALSDDDTNVRVNVATTLSKMGNCQAVEVLIQTLSDKRSLWRMSAAAALGEIANPQAMEVLIQGLIHGDGIVPEIAIGALGEIGTSETLAKLIQLPEIDINHPWIFLLARTLAVRFSKERLPFIPVYPELVAHKQ